jgi:hypothetical protein
MQPVKGRAELQTIPWTLISKTSALTADPLGWVVTLSGMTIIFGHPNPTKILIVIVTEVPMGLLPTQGDEKRPLFSNCSQWKRRPLLCDPECSRDLQFCGLLLEMFFDGVNGAG